MVDQGPNEPERLTLLQVFSSVFAALFGVQSRERRERDFAKGTPGQFIFVGIVAVAVFVLVLFLLVRLVLHLAGV